MAGLKRTLITVSILLLLSCKTTQAPVIPKLNHEELKVAFSGLELRDVKITAYKRYKQAILFNAILVESRTPVLLIGSTKFLSDKFNVPYPTYFKKKDSIYVGLQFEAILQRKKYKEKGKKLIIEYSDEELTRIKKKDRVPLYFLENSFELLYRPNS